LLRRLLHPPPFPYTTLFRSPFARRHGTNLVIVGQRDDAAAAMMATSLLSLAAQFPPGAAEFVLMDGTPAGTPCAGVLPRIAESLDRKSTRLNSSHVKISYAV